MRHGSGRFCQAGAVPRNKHKDVARYGYFINGEAPEITLHIRDRVLGRSVRYKKLSSVEAARERIASHKADHPQERVAKEWLCPRR